MNKIKKFMLNIFTSGTFDVYEVGKRSRIIFLNAIMLIGIGFLFSFSLREAQEGKNTLSLITLTCGSIILIMFILLRILKIFTFGNFFIVVLMTALFGFLVVTGGSGSSGFIWAFSYPLIALFLVGITFGSIFCLVMGAALTISMLVPSISSYTFEMDFKLRIIGVYAFIYVFSVIYAIVQNSTQKQLKRANTDLKNTSDALSEAKTKTDTIMENVEQGIFLLNRFLCFENEHSKFLCNIFNRTNFGGENIMDILGPHLDQKAFLATKDYLDLFFRENVNRDLLKEINPLEKVGINASGSGGRREKIWLRFFFAPIKSPDGTPMVIGLVNDISEEIHLEEFLKEEKTIRNKGMEILYTIINTDPAMMSEFIEHSEQELVNVGVMLKDRDKPVRDLLMELFQSIHSVKSNAVLLELGSFAEQAHALENKIKQLQEKQDNASEEILDLMYDISALEEELEEIRELIKRLANYRSADSFEQSDAAGLLGRTIRQAIEKQASAEQKDVNADIADFDISIVPENYRKILKDILVQLARNAVSHGIETPKNRITSGKNETGIVTLKSSTVDGRILISITDDGAGITVPSILKAAGKIDKFKNRDLSKLPEGKILGLIFQPGFSTRQESDLGAGQGVGMNIIKSRIEKAGGKLKVKTRAGRYTQFVIELPELPV